MQNKDLEKRFIKKENNSRMKMEKWQIKNSEKWGISKISEKLF